MDIRHRLAFTDDADPQFIKYLLDHGLLKPPAWGIYSLWLSESSEHWPFLREYIKPEKGISVDTETDFSKEELENAEYLYLWSRWRKGYPQPEDGFREITYSDHAHCKQCGCGREQIAPFRMKGTINWGNRHFMMMFGVDEIFLDDIAKAVLEQSDLSGMAFLPVENKSGRAVLENVWQWKVSDMLSPGLQCSDRTIKRMTLCTSCGRVKYVSSGIGMLTFRREAFQNASDIVKTWEEFGDGRGACRYIVVSQKVYQILHSNHLDRSLVLEPVRLI